MKLPLNYTYYPKKTFLTFLKRSGLSLLNLNLFMFIKHHIYSSCYVSCKCFILLFMCVYSAKNTEESIFLTCWEWGCVQSQSKMCDERLPHEV